MKLMMCVRLGWVTFELITWPGTPLCSGDVPPLSDLLFSGITSMCLVSLSDFDDGIYEN